jgi:hypothetical protein
MNTDVPLIKVNTLSKKLAGQITMLPDDYSGNVKSVQNRILAGLAQHHTGPLGWVMGATLGNGARPGVKFWLVKFQDQLYFIKACDETSDTGKYFSHTPQLFIS